MEFLVINKSVIPPKISKITESSVEAAFIALKDKGIDNFKLYINVSNKEFTSITEEIHEFKESVQRINKFIKNNELQSFEPIINNLEERIKTIEIESNVIKLSLASQIEQLDIQIKKLNRKFDCRDPLLLQILNQQNNIKKEEYMKKGALPTEAVKDEEQNCEDGKYASPQENITDINLDRFDKNYFFGPCLDKIRSGDRSHSLVKDLMTYSNGKIAQIVKKGGNKQEIQHRRDILMQELLNSDYQGTSADLDGTHTESRCLTY